MYGYIIPMFVYNFIKSGCVPFFDVLQSFYIFNVSGLDVISNDYIADSISQSFFSRLSIEMPIVFLLFLVTVFILSLYVLHFSFSDELRWSVIASSLY